MAAATREKWPRRQRTEISIVRQCQHRGTGPRAVARVAGADDRRAKANPSGSALQAAGTGTGAFVAVRGLDADTKGNRQGIRPARIRREPVSLLDRIAAGKARQRSVKQF